MAEEITCTCGLRVNVLALGSQIDCLTRERDEWRNAVTDAAVVDWVLTDANQEGPRDIINSLLSHAQRIALDPKVSEEAAKLLERAETAERERDEAREALRLIIDEAHSSERNSVDSLIEIIDIAGRALGEES